MTASKINIVCFEDNPGDVFLIKSYLDDTPMLSYEFNNFERLDTGMEYLKHNKPDIVILDLGLPDSSGIDTFKKLQQSFTELTIIVVTGNIDAKVGLEAVHNGAQDYLIKSEISQNLLSRSILYSIERKRITRELGVAKHKAEMADKLKTTFLANMSHDLRTPMNSIIGFSELLKDCSSDDQRIEYVNIIIKNGEILLHLLNDIIDISKIESGQLNINKKEFNLNELFNDLYINFEKKLKDRHLEKEVELCLSSRFCSEGFYVNTDKARLYQVLGNLLDNAVKFTLKGSIEFGGYQADDKLIFFVKDTGIGIPKDKQNNIFERFSQVEDTLEYNISGTGLGLTISKNLTELLGGKIAIKSEPGKGSEFVFEIPYEKRANTATPIAQKTGKISKGLHWVNKTILIVEDIESNRHMLETALRKTGVGILIATTGEKAIEIAKTNQAIDLVLMDIRLPGICGCEATREIVKIRKGLPVIAQTALALEDQEKKCLESGAVAYLTKPIKPAELLNTISMYI